MVQRVVAATVTRGGKVVQLLAEVEQRLDARRRGASGAGQIADSVFSHRVDALIDGLRQLNHLRLDDAVVEVLLFQRHVRRGERRVNMFLLIDHQRDARLGVGLRVKRRAGRNREACRTAHVQGIANLHVVLAELHLVLARYALTNDDFVLQRKKALVGIHHRILENVVSHCKLPHIFFRPREIGRSILWRRRR